MRREEAKGEGSLAIASARMRAAGVARPSLGSSPPAIGVGTEPERPSTSWRAGRGAWAGGVADRHWHEPPGRAESTAAVGVVAIGLTADGDPAGLAAVADSQQHPPAGSAGQQHPARLIGDVPAEADGWPITSHAATTAATATQGHRGRRRIPAMTISGGNGTRAQRTGHNTDNLTRIPGKGKPDPAAGRARPIVPERGGPSRKSPPGVRIGRTPGRPIPMIRIRGPSTRRLLDNSIPPPIRPRPDDRDGRRDPLPNEPN